MQPQANHLREQLQGVAAALRVLHRALLDEQRAEHERAHGPVGSGQLLHLATSDPSFAWLRVLSEFMADLDALLDEPPPPGGGVLGGIPRARLQNGVYRRAGPCTNNTCRRRPVSSSSALRLSFAGIQAAYRKGAGEGGRGSIRLRNGRQCSAPRDGGGARCLGRAPRASGALEDL
jgi:hypothetical protein